MLHLRELFSRTKAKAKGCLISGFYCTVVVARIWSYTGNVRVNPLSPPISSAKKAIRPEKYCWEKRKAFTSYSYISYILHRDDRWNKRNGIWQRNSVCRRTVWTLRNALLALYFPPPERNISWVDKITHKWSHLSSVVVSCYSSPNFPHQTAQDSPQDSPIRVKRTWKEGFHSQCFQK